MSSIETPGQQALHVVAGSMAGVVHDLGNLIQIATSAVRIISRNPEVVAVPSVDPLLMHATTSLERAAALVRQSIGQRNVPAAEALRIDTCLAQLKPLLQYACGPQVAVELASDLPIAIECRRLDFENAILNLTLNARDAMPDGGVLRIQTDVAEGPEIPEAVIVVADTGSGMTPEIAARALEPFFTTKPEGRGSGTGLPSVKAFVDEAGGRMSISTAPANGTAITLRLPIAGTAYR
jgi:signal transduction histidine kinase